MGCLLNFLVVVDKICIGPVAVDIDKGVQKDSVFDGDSIFYTAVVKTVFTFLHIITVKHIEVDTSQGTAFSRTVMVDFIG